MRNRGEEVPGFTTFKTCPNRAQTKGEKQEEEGGRTPRVRKQHYIQARQETTAE